MFTLKPNQTLNSTTMKKKKVGRPRKLYALNDNVVIVDLQSSTTVPAIGVVVPVKRGRGRPRKYPIKESSEPPQLLKLSVEPGMTSVWGNVKKGKRVHKFRRKESASEGSDQSGVVSAEEEELSWLSRIVIPGPIPDLDSIFMDQSFLRSSDFFSDILVPTTYDF